MPFMTVRGARLQYEILGSNGPWVALSPGGRRPMASVRGLAQRLAAACHRVLIHDRRNCGASDLLVTGAVPEYRVWADDLHPPPPAVSLERQRRPLRDAALVFGFEAVYRQISWACFPKACYLMWRPL